MNVENNLPEPFIRNKYYEKMMAIIENSKNNPPLINYEIHHIIPRSYYKKLGLRIDNSKNNLIKLSFEDHMLVHFYLAFCASEIISGEMACAANIIFRIKNITEEFAKKHSKELAEIKIKTKESSCYTPPPPQKKIKVICIETGTIYNSLSECLEITNINPYNAVRSKNHIAHNMHFMYYDEYLKNPKSVEDFKNLDTIRKTQKKYLKKVRCIQTGEIFESCKAVCEKYNISNLTSYIKSRNNSKNPRKDKLDFEYI